MRKYLREILWAVFLVFVIVFMWSTMSQALVWHPANQSTFAWDPVTETDTGGPLSPGDSITYRIYLRQIIGTTVQPDQLVAQISETTYTVTFPNEGKFIVGVQTVRITGGGGGDPPVELTSAINWSDVNGVMTPVPFGFVFYQNPSGVVNLRQGP